MSLDRRLAALEDQGAPDRGWRSVTECPGGYFGRMPGMPFDYSLALPTEDGSPPAGATFFTRADIDAMLSEGWNVVVIRHIQDWRSDESGPEVSP